MTLVRAPEHVAAEILEELIDRVCDGDQVEITRDGETVVRLAQKPDPEPTRFGAGIRTPLG